MCFQCVRILQIFDTYNSAVWYNLKGWPASNLIAVFSSRIVEYWHMIFSFCNFRMIFNFLYIINEPTVLEIEA